MAVQHENFGLLDYKPKCDAIPLRGFHSEEFLSGDLKFQVMSGKRATILVRNKEKVSLPYFLMNDAENLSLTVTTDRMGAATIPVQTNGLIEMTFPPAEEPWEVTLELSLELSRVFIDAQGKEFGLAIIFEVR